jgi:hypothetical protein
MVLKINKNKIKKHLQGLNSFLPFGNKIAIWKYFCQIELKQQVVPKKSNSAKFAKIRV